MPITFTKEVIHELANGGDIYEFGVYRGKSLIEILTIFKSHGLPYKHAHGFDSFVGLPSEAEGV